MIAHLGPALQHLFSCMVNLDGHALFPSCLSFLDFLPSFLSRVASAGERASASVGERRQAGRHVGKCRQGIGLSRQVRRQVMSIRIPVADDYTRVGIINGRAISSNGRSSHYITRDQLASSEQTRSYKSDEIIIIKHR